MNGQKKEMTISEEMELDWNDGKYSDSDERIFQREFELGWDDLINTYMDAGYHQLMFNPMKLVV